MTRNSDTLDSIREINLSYLELAQRLLQADRVVAQHQLGLTEQIAETLERLTEAQREKLANSSQLLCFFRMSDQLLLGGLAEKPRKETVSISCALDDLAMVG